MKESIKSWLGAFIFFFVAWWLVSLFQQQKLLSDGTEIPMFSLTTLDGGIVTDQELKGSNVLLYFFAPWCHICHFSIDNVETIKQNLNEEVSVYAIALDFENKLEIEQFVREHELTIPILLGNRDIAERFLIRGYPTYYVANPQGEIVAKDMGFSSELGMKLRLMF